MSSKPETKTATAVSSAYQLAASENPGAVIAQVHFNGENFDEWAQAIRTALRVKKKFGFVDGSVQPPSDDAPEYEDWISANSMVTLWILNTVDPKVRKTLANKEDPVELWKEIKDRFSEGNGPRIHEIKTELAFCRQGTMSVINYFGRLQVLWEDLSNYEKTLVRKCGKCTCDLNTELEKKKEEDRIHQFLLGLDDTVYGGVRTSIISTDPLPNLNQVYSKVKSVERINTVMRGREQQTSQVAFATRATLGGGNEDKSRMVCTACKKKGHTAETCFQVIGYPEWWGDRARQGGRGSGRGTGRGRGMIRANAAMIQDGEEVSKEAERSGYTGLSNEQWGTLIKLLEEKQRTESQLTGPYNEKPEWRGGA